MLGRGTWLSPARYSGSELIHANLELALLNFQVLSAVAPMSPMTAVATMSADAAMSAMAAMPTVGTRPARASSVPTPSTGRGDSTACTKLGDF